jgi:anti-sigma regulatory factor (Ser/Thr protein kinase)
MEQRVDASTAGVPAGALLERRERGRQQIVWREWASSDLAAPAAARRAVLPLLAGVPPSLAEDLLVAVSELVTNAVIHARPPMVLVAEREGDVLRVGVDDASTRRARLVAPGPGGGRGLHLVARLAARWGSAERPGGKTTWAVFELPRRGAG